MVTSMVLLWESLFTKRLSYRNLNVITIEVPEDKLSVLTLKQILQKTSRKDLRKFTLEISQEGFPAISLNKLQ